MEAHRTKATVKGDGEVTLERGVPFAPGEKVDVIVLAEKKTSSPSRQQHGARKQHEAERGTAGALRNSALAGLWEHRDEELPPSPAYARRLRERAQRRPHVEEELKKLDLGRDSS